MVVCVILAISLMAIATIQTEYMKRQTVYLRRMIGQNLLASFISDVQSQGRQYPLLTSNGASVTYLFCYGKDGVPLQTDNHQMGAQVVTTPLDDHFPSPICTNGLKTANGYEVHMVRDLTAPDYADIRVIGLQNGNTLRHGEDVAYSVRVYIPQTF